MAQYPTQNKHRPSRRSLPSSQAAQPAAATVVVTATASTATLTYSRPVNVAGLIPLVVAGKTVVTQTVVSSTVVTILMSGALTGLAWSLTTPTPMVTTYQGGGAIGGSGTFP